MSDESRNIEVAFDVLRRERDGYKAKLEASEAELTRVNADFKTHGGVLLDTEAKLEASEELRLDLDADWKSWCADETRDLNKDNADLKAKLEASERELTRVNADFKAHGGVLLDTEAKLARVVDIAEEYEPVAAPIEFYRRQYERFCAVITNVALDRGG